jgi:hypothetical protein
MVDKHSDKAGSPDFSIRKSQAFVWIFFVVAVIMIGFIYMMLMKPLSFVYNYSYNDSTVNDSVYQQFYERSATIWYWTPILLVLSMILWAVIQVQKRSQYG